jgi:hypothetical protein
MGNLSGQADLASSAPTAPGRSLTATTSRSDCPPGDGTQPLAPS